MWTSEEIIHFIAEAYHNAALANADMRCATKALETIRSSILEGQSPFKVWDVIDEQIGLAEIDFLQSVLITLRNRYEQKVTTKVNARLLEVLRRDPQAGWIEWLKTYAEALSLWRLQFCFALANAELPFPTQKEWDIEEFKKCSKLLLHERWSETFDLFNYLVHQKFIPSVQRAKLYLIAAQIELYHFLKPDKALELIHRAKDLAGDESRVFTGLGEYWMQQNEMEKAKEHFQKAIELAPHSSSGYTSMGTCYEKLKDFTAAEEWHTEAISNAPGESYAYISLFRLYGHPGLFQTNQEKIMPLVKLAIAVNPTDEYATYLYVGNIYKQNNEYEKAHHWYIKAIELDDTRLEGYISKGYAEIEEEKFDQARFTFQKGIEVAEEAFDGYQAMGWLYELRRQWEDALFWYEESLKRQPRWTETVRVRINKIKWELKKYQEAVEGSIETLRNEPDNEMVLRNLHMFADEYYENLDDPKSGLRILDEIRKIKGESYEADYQNRIGNLKYYYGEYKEAVDAYCNAVTADPNTAVYHTNLADAYRELKEWNKARDEVEMAFRLNKAEDVYRREMALIFNAEGNEYFSQATYRNAIEGYEEAIRLQPDDAVYHSNLALAWENRKEPGTRAQELENAISATEKAHELDPDEGTYLERLDALQRKKNIAEHFGEKAIDRLPVVTPIAMEVAGNLIPYVEGSKKDGLSAEMAKNIREMRERILNEFGVRIPGIRIRENETDLPDGTYIIMINEIPIVSGNISLNKRLLPSMLEELTSLGILGEKVTNSLTGDDAFWIKKEDWKKVEARGLKLWDIIEYPVRHLQAVIQKNLSEFVGHQEVMHILETENKKVFDEITNSPEKLTALTRVLKGLVSEEVPIKPFDEIFDAFDKLYSAGENCLTIVETIRSSDKIRPELPGNNNKYSFLQLGRRFEAEIERCIFCEDSHSLLAMEPEDCQTALKAVRDKVGSNCQVGLLVKNTRLRPFVRKLTELEFPSVPVLSRQEFQSDLEANIIGEIELEKQINFATQDTRLAEEKGIFKPEKERTQRKERVENYIEEDITGMKTKIRIFFNNKFTKRTSAAEDKPIEEMLEIMQDGLFYELGIILPKVQIEIDKAIKTNEFQIQLNDLHPQTFHGLAKDQFLVNDIVDRLSHLDITGEKAINPANGSECAKVLDRNNALEKCENMGLTTWGPTGFLVLSLASEIKKNADIFLTKNIVDYNLDQLHRAFPALVDMTRKRFSIEKLTLILRNLLDEEIAIGDLRSILESLLSINGTTDVDLSKYIIVFSANTDNLCPVTRKKHLDDLDIVDYSNFGRISLKRYISHKYTRGGNTLVVYLLNPNIEMRIKEMEQDDKGYLRLIRAISSEVVNLPATAQSPVVLTTVEIRRKLRKLIENEFPYLAVLCYQELSPDISIQPIARISWD